MVEDKLGIDVSTLLDTGEYVQIVNEWSRGGAETYVSDFLVRQNEVTVGHYIAKACIRMCPKETMQDWLGRRTALEDAGIVVPELHIVDGATLVEEFIPRTFIDAHKAGSEQNRAILEENFIKSYMQIRGAGFRPVSFHDIRSRGDDVVVIDVGEDLGPVHPMDSCSLSVIGEAREILLDILGER